MPGPNPPDLQLLYKATTTGRGYVLGNGTNLARYASGSGKPNQNGFWTNLLVHCRLTDTVTGASATVLYQDSPDGTTWTTRFTQPLAIIATANPFSRSHHFMFKTDKPFFSLNLSALSGGSAPTVDAYCTYGAAGQ